MKKYIILGRLPHKCNIKLQKGSNRHLAFFTVVNSYVYISVSDYIVMSCLKYLGRCDCESVHSFDGLVNLFCT